MTKRKPKFIYTCSKCGAPAISSTNAKLEKNKQGLGTWHCSNGCPKRQYSIDRFIGSGKEAEKDRKEAFPVRRPIAVTRRPV